LQVLLSVSSRKGAVMIQVLSSDETIQSVVCEALERASQAEGEAPNAVETFFPLRRAFPQATIITLSLPALLNAVHKAVQSQDE
jgi:hypothetical protein